MKTKKILTLTIGIMMLVVGLLACAPAQTPAPATQAPATQAPAAEAPAPATAAPVAEPAPVGGLQPGFKVGYTCMTMNNPFFIILEKSAREVIEAAGGELITVDPHMDVALQISQVEDLITQGIQAILLNPVDWEGVRPALVAPQQANIPVINFDAEVKDMDFVTAYAGSDNVNAGFVCGEDMVKQFPDGGKIAVLDSPTMNSVNDRITGFMNAIGDKFEIVAQQDAKGDLQTAMTIMDDVLQAHPDIIAVMGGNDPTALGILASCKAANRNDIAIYGVDGSPDAKQEIAKDGSQFLGSGAQSPISIGRISAELAMKILSGETVPARTPVETFLINKDNVSNFPLDDWQ